MSVYECHIYYHRPLKKGTLCPPFMLVECESLELLKSLLMPVAVNAYRIIESRKKSGDFSFPEQSDFVVKEIKDFVLLNENGS